MAFCCSVIEACPLCRIIDSSSRMRGVECQSGKMAALRAGLLTRALTKGKAPRISEIILGTRAGAVLYTCHPLIMRMYAIKTVFYMIKR